MGDPHPFRHSPLGVKILSKDDLKRLKTVLKGKTVAAQLGTGASYFQLKKKALTLIREEAIKATGIERV